MRLDFINNFFRMPIPGYVSDVCDGAPQRPCVPQYFSNYKDVGYKLNIISADLTNPQFQLKFKRPFIIVGFAVNTFPVMTNDPAVNSAQAFPSFKPADPASQDQYMLMFSKMFQNMQETTVDNRPTVEMGLSWDNSIGYNLIDGSTNYNFYFNNYTSQTQVELMENFIIIMQVVSAFWTYASGLSSFDESYNAFINFCERIMKITDLRLWGSPGIYTIDTANTSDWITGAGDYSGSGLNDWITNQQGGVRASILVIEQKSIE